MSSKHDSLSGRRAVVTSGARNLGASIARALAGRGAQVTITYKHSGDIAEALVADLVQSTRQPHRAIRMDLADVETIPAVIDEAAERAGGVDILVNNFGPFSIVPLHRLPLAEWRRVWSGNVETVQLAVAAAAPIMRSAGWGRVVNVSAGSAQLRNHSIYGLAKSAVELLTESLALELGPEITVNAVAPGQIAESAEDIGDIDATFVARSIQRTPLGRLVTRKQVADVVAAICEPQFDMLTGAVLPLDGGWRFNRF